MKLRLMMIATLLCGAPAFAEELPRYTALEYSYSGAQAHVGERIVLAGGHATFMERGVVFAPHNRREYFIRLHSLAADDEATSLARELCDADPVTSCWGYVTGIVRSDGALDDATVHVRRETMD